MRSLIDSETLVIASSDFVHYGQNYGYVPFNKNIPEKIKELEGYFAIGLTDEEACLMADISRTCLNDYYRKNEKWRERKETLKKKP